MQILTREGDFNRQINGKDMKSQLHPYLEGSRPIAFAHRGASSSKPENTMAAFETAINLGYQYIETDVHLTRDNNLIAFHDDRLDRVTDKSGIISEMDWDDIRLARVDGTEPIPLFSDLLKAFPEVRINVDPKSDDAVAPLLKCLEDFNALGRVCLGSFSGDRLKRARVAVGRSLCTSTSPVEVLNLRLASLTPKKLGHFLLSTLGADCIQVPVLQYGIRIIDPAFIRCAHDLGLKIHVWTINEEAEMHRLLDLGVDGLMSDNAELLKAVLQSRNLW